MPVGDSDACMVISIWSVFACIHAEWFYNYIKYSVLSVY